MSDTAGVVIRPPVLFLICLVAGLLLEWVLPPARFESPWLWALGLVLIAGGAALVITAAQYFRRAGTSVPTWRPTTALVPTGPYRFTRNPIYIGLSAIYLGIAALAGSLWIALLVVPALLVLHFGVVLREEAYLERRFGEEYRAYRTRVRRWI
jgi:protein-S-isoprenylcysteine O-methyltransferase Ste14